MPGRRARMRLSEAKKELAEAQDSIDVAIEFKQAANMLLSCVHPLGLAAACVLACCPEDESGLNMCMDTISQDLSGENSVMLASCRQALPVCAAIELARLDDDRTAALDACRPAVIAATVGLARRASYDPSEQEVKNGDDSESDGGTQIPVGINGFASYTEARAQLVAEGRGRARAVELFPESALEERTLLLCGGAVVRPPGGSLLHPVDLDGAKDQGHLISGGAYPLAVGVLKWYSWKCELESDRIESAVGQAEQEGFTKDAVTRCFQAMAAAEAGGM